MALQSPHLTSFSINFWKIELIATDIIEAFPSRTFWYQHILSYRTKYLIMRHIATKIDFVSNVNNNTIQDPLAWYHYTQQRSRFVADNHLPIIKATLPWFRQKSDITSLYSMVAWTCVFFDISSNGWNKANPSLVTFQARWLRYILSVETNKKENMQAKIWYWYRKSQYRK